MRRAILVVSALLLASPAWAAAPTLGGQATPVAASLSNTVIAVPDVDAGNAVAVIYLQTATGARTVSVTDECGNTYVHEANGPGYNVGRAASLWVAYASTCTDASLDVTVDQSGTVTAYTLLAFEIDCPNDCAADTDSAIGNSATTSHHASASADVIDTANDVFVFSACVGSASFGVETDSGADWTFLNDGTNTSIMAQYRTATTALSNERGTTTSSNSRDSDCAIVSVKESGGSGGGTTGRMLLLGVG